MGGSTVEVSGSAGLFEDKKWCRMVEEDRCVSCVMEGRWKMLSILY